MPGAGQRDRRPASARILRARSLERFSEVGRDRQALRSRCIFGCMYLQFGDCLGNKSGQSCSPGRAWAQVVLEGRQRSSAGMLTNWASTREPTTIVQAAWHVQTSCTALHEKTYLGLCKKTVYLVVLQGPYALFELRHWVDNGSFLSDMWVFHQDWPQDHVQLQSLLAPVTQVNIRVKFTYILCLSMTIAGGSHTDQQCPLEES